MKSMVGNMRARRAPSDEPVFRKRAGRRAAVCTAITGGRAEGFTLFELLIIMVLVGLLSAVAMPVFLNEELRVVPAAEQVAGEIRYAQSLAMTHGDSYAFNVSGNTFTISKGTGGSMPLSNGDASGSFDGLNLSIDGGGSGSVTFSSLFGQADAAHTVQVTGGGASASVSVSTETGYVRVQS